MGFTDWFKNLFGSKEECYHNIILVESETEPKLVKGKNGKVVIKFGNIDKPWDRFNDGGEFVAINEKFEYGQFKPKGQLWAIDYNLPAKKIDREYGNVMYYRNGRDGGWKWAPDQEEFVKKVIRLIEAAREGDSDQNDETEPTSATTEVTTPAAKAENKVETTTTPEEEDDAFSVDDDDTPAEVETAEATEVKPPVYNGVTEQSSSQQQPETGDVPKPQAEVEELDKEIQSKLIELLKMVNHEIKEQSVDELLAALKNRIKDLQDGLKAAEKTKTKLDEQAREYKSQLEAAAIEQKNLSEAKGFLDMANKELEKEKETLDKANKKLKEEKDSLNNKCGELKEKIAKIEKAKEDLVKSKEFLEARNNTLLSEKLDLENKVEELNAENLKLKESDAGKLSDRINELTHERDNALKEKKTLETSIERKNEQIDELKEKKVELTGKLTERTNDLQRTQKELKKCQDDIEKLEKTKAELSKELEDTTEILSMTEEDLNSSKKQVDTLSKQVNDNETRIAKLEVDMKSAEEAKVKAQGILKTDVEALAATYTKAAEVLATAVAEDFISECNPEADTDTVASMCNKIRKGIISITDEIRDLAGKNFESTIKLTETYNAIIAKAVDSNAFTEIARWWAYSRLPFVANRNREEGRAVEFKSINQAYAAEARLLDLAGYRYQIPVLFVENISEGDYENLTGQEQLNLDYQYPNVRRHAENIDRDDRCETILDIVRLGYYKDDTLVKKTSVII